MFNSFMSDMMSNLDLEEIDRECIDEDKDKDFSLFENVSHQKIKFH